MKYYAFEYKSGRYTTTGTPNKKTNRLSIAGNLHAFSSINERINWVDKGETTADMAGNCRHPVTHEGARGLHLGMSVQEYTEYLNTIG